jgi:hypothetical protein
MQPPIIRIDHHALLDRRASATSSPNCREISKGCVTNKASKVPHLSGQQLTEPELSQKHFQFEFLNFLTVLKGMWLQTLEAVNNKS